MKKPEITILSTLVNSLFAGEVTDDTALFVLNKTGELDKTTDEMQTMRYLFTCSASIAQLSQKHHSKETLKDFFDKLGHLISAVDNIMEDIEGASADMKIKILEDMRDLAQAYGDVVLKDAALATLDSAATDLVIQSAINGMMMTVMEQID